MPGFAIAVAVIIGNPGSNCRGYWGSWCERRDSNSHGLPHWNLNPARLPIPPLSHVMLFPAYDSSVFAGGYPKSSKTGVNDGTRTHDNRNHNPGLYQLSYAHHDLHPKPTIIYIVGAPDRTRTCNLRLSLPATTFVASIVHDRVWGLDYIFTISGGTRIVSTDP